ncbi:MAG: lysophospholipid acyltransferase family protein, partial [Woeseiaceae bacterium]
AIVFMLPGIRVAVSGVENIPDDNCVVVANHASYIDGVLLKAYLPARFSFVIKGELRNIPVAHFLLRRSGAKFVERNKHAASARDARQIVRAAQDGQSLALFPEGTFREEPGIGQFRPGAFVAAVRGNMPVVPVAIRGTRYMLPAGRMLPRPNTLDIEVLPPIYPDDVAFTDSRKLAETARLHILAVLDEPDLAESDPDPQAALSN